MKKLFGLFVFTAALCGLSMTASAETFTAYLTPAQEVPAVASTGSGRAVVVVNSAGTSLTFSVVFNGMTSAQTLSHIHAPAPIGSTAAVIINFGTVGGTSGTISGTAAITAGQLSNLRSGQGYVNVHSSNFPNGELRGQLLPARPVDNDGDGRTDISLLRFPAGPPSPITYFNLNSTSGQSSLGPFGDAQTDFPCPGDYDGDGKADVCLYRAGATAGADSVFYVILSSNSTFQGVRWGVNGDQAVSRDFDGDGITNFAVYRRGAAAGAQSFWFIRRPDNSQISIPFGLTGDGTNTDDTPVAGDYDGDGKFDCAVYRFGYTGSEYNNAFIVLRSSTNTVSVQQWGNFNTDYVLPGDYDGDGKTDYCVARTGAAAATPVIWFILRSSTGTLLSGTFGRSDDLPVQGDYDGDGKTDLAMFRPSTRVTYVHNSFNGSDTGVQFGATGDYSVARFDSR